MFAIGLSHQGNSTFTTLGVFSTRELAVQVLDYFGAWHNPEHTIKTSGKEYVIAENWDITTKFSRNMEQLGFTFNTDVGDGYAMPVLEIREIQPDMIVFGYNQE